MIRLFSNLTKKQADLVLLILASQAIPAVIQPQAGRVGFDILVPADHCAAASFHVNRYVLENQEPAAPTPSPAFGPSAFSAPGAFVIMGLLILVHAMSCAKGFHRALIMDFGASNLYIMQGETFRAVTALFIHADTRHLMGNLGGLLIFASPLIRVSGYGTGSLLLLAAGTSGNLLNAWLQANARLSIGASTAVMGAAGGLAACQMTLKKNGAAGFESLKSRIWNRLIPFFGAATLVAMFSHGETTDVWAHVLGFFMGFGIGVVFFPFHRTFEHRFKEPSALLACIIILITALVSGTTAGL